MSYSAVANNGILNQPLAINLSRDNNDLIIKEFTSESVEVADQKEIFILRDMMKSVIDNGTGGSLRWKYKFYAPMAGKMEPLIAKLMLGYSFTHTLLLEYGVGYG